MAFEIQETSGLLVPNIEEKLAAFKEVDFSKKHGLIIEIAAIHEGVTNNFNRYTESALRESLKSWLEPYPKPVITNHDLHGEAIGRIVGATMAKEDDGTPFVRLQAAITDPAAIEKIKDQRMLTGSVGGRAEESVCNICGTDWAKAIKENGPGVRPCRHTRGKVYDGKVAEMYHDGLLWKEYSFVNLPSDARSGVRGVEVTEAVQEQENSSWSSKPRFFVLDLTEEEVIEYDEGDNKDVLGEMKKKEASPLYHSLRGAFLEAQVVNKIEEDGVKRHLNNTKDVDGINNSEETDQMANTDTTVEQQEDDVLAVTEQLSTDLSAAADQTTESEEGAGTEQTPEEPAGETDAPAEETAPATEEAPEAEAPAEDAVETTDAGGSEDVEEGERAEGQEKAHKKDVNPETSEGAPQNRESEEAGEEPTETGSEEPQDTGTEEQTPEPELTDTQTAESPEEESKSDVEALEAENAALKEKVTLLTAALHRTLAERVVDTKIAKGVAESSERETLLEEHVQRTASSLADTMRDLAEMPNAAHSPSETDMSMEVNSEVVEGESNVSTIGETEGSTDSRSVADKVEDELVETLMGRRPTQL